MIHVLVLWLFKSVQVGCSLVANYARSARIFGEMENWRLPIGNRMKFKHLALSFEGQDMHMHIATWLLNVSTMPVMLAEDRS